MYTNIRSYQQIIALLKKYNIRNCVLSAGSRNVPFVHSVEKDPFFKCYSVVDERSAGYFALGLSQKLNEPVVISCTSSTATCNYWPPIAEAYYQGVPLIVLTSDRNPAMLGQWEDQMIDQVGMYDRHVKKSVNLPIIKDENDEYFSERLINEALLELDHRGKGPIHINIPTKNYSSTFDVKELPEVKKINRVNLEDKESLWEAYYKELKMAKRILVVCGQSSKNNELDAQIKKFFEKFNSAIIVDHMSNIGTEYGLNTSVALDTRYCSKNKFSELIPDIVISFGGNVFSGIKEQLRQVYKKTKHFSIQEDGRVVDLFMSLDTIFECSPLYFFKKMNDLSKDRNNYHYYNELKECINNVKYPEFDFSHIYAIKQVVEQIPKNSILHLSINDSIRISNFFSIQDGIETFANIGTHGIDGCLSSFLGQAAADKDKESFLIIGDLAYFYDMNATRLNSINNNVHILLINNEGGSEFYYNGMWQDEYSDLHTTARHHTKAKEWVKDNGFDYYSADNKESLKEVLPMFMKTNLTKPVFLEVFTEMKTDADEIYKFYNYSKPVDLKTEAIKKGKNFIKKTIGTSNAKKIGRKMGLIK